MDIERTTEALRDVIQRRRRGLDLPASVDFDALLVDALELLETLEPYDDDDEEEEHCDTCTCFEDDEPAPVGDVGAALRERLRSATTEPPR